MPIAALLARVLLSGVFMVAGAAKIIAPARSKRMLVEFGVPVALAGPLGVLLPLAELSVGIALLFASTAWAGAIAALAILVVFSAVLVFNLARGRTPDCNCFGQIHAAPIGWSTVIRNGALAAVAAFVVWVGRENAGLSIVSVLSALPVTVLVASLAGLGVLALLGAIVALLVQVLLQQGRMLVRLDAIEGRLLGGMPGAIASSRTLPGLLVGSPAPSFSLNSLDGQVMTLEALTAHGRPVLALFTNPRCGPCEALLPEIRRWQEEYAKSLTFVLVSEGSEADNRERIAAHNVGPILLQQKREVAESYLAWGTPAAVLIGPHGAIWSPVAQGADAIQALVEQAAREPGRFVAAQPSVAHANGQTGNGSLAAPAAKIGDPAPSPALRDLSGRSVKLRELLSGETLVLFWNPNCGFCQRMLTELKQWEAQRPPGSPHLLVVSTGTVEENAAMQLQSTVVLDEGFQAGTAFGAGGTPMGVLVDADGRISSAVAAGAQAVFELAKSNNVAPEL